jgi:acetolactate synthase-1/2/3 large subunit
MSLIFMTVVEQIVDQLANYGLDTYFLVTGGAIVPFVDAVGRNSRSKYYCFQNEQGAAMAAEAYWRVSGKIAVVLVTSGPGVQNTLNGVCGCWYDSVPCLVVSGQVNTSESLNSIKSRPRQVGFQEMPVVDIFKTCTLMSEQIQSADNISDVFSRALAVLMGNVRSGPVLIDFPVNLQMASTPVNITVSYPCPTWDKVNVVDEIRQSKRPLVIIGNGSRKSKVREWIDAAGIPFVASWAAIDIIPHDHPLFIGCHGVYGDRTANYAVQNADLLIILGSRMDTRQTGGNLSTCSRVSRRIMVDVDKEEIEKLSERGFRIDVPIISTVDEFILQNEVKNLDIADWVKVVDNWKAEFGNEITREGNVYQVLEDLWKTLPDECIVIPDSGGNLTWTMQTIHPKKGQRVFSSLGNSSMGYSLPASIGAAIGTDCKVPIYCIEGDGGLQMNIQELSTLAKYKLPVKVIVLNNAGYGIIKQFQDAYFEGRHTATSTDDVFGDSTPIDLQKIGEGYGVEITDLKIDTDQKIYPKLEFGNALENMAPYRPELHKYMIVPPVEAIKGVGWITK